MPKIRADVRVDANQDAQKIRLLACPKCGQKLVDVEHLRGMAILRFKCRRCGTYVKADIIGA